MLTRSRYAVQQRLAEPNLGTSFSQAWPQLSAVQVHAKRGLRVPVACVLHAANDGLDATAEDEVVCGVTVELFLPSSRGRSDSDWTTHHAGRCESEVRYSTAMDPRVAGRVTPVSTTATHSQIFSLKQLDRLQDAPQPLARRARRQSYAFWHADDIANGWRLPSCEAATTADTKQGLNPLSNAIAVESLRDPRVPCSLSQRHSHLPWALLNHLHISLSCEGRPGLRNIPFVVMGGSPQDSEKS